MKEQNNDRVLQQFLAETPQSSELLRDPNFLRACLTKRVLNGEAFKFPVPTPPILEDWGLVALILQRFPEFLRHSGIPPDFFTDRDLYNQRHRLRDPQYIIQCRRTVSYFLKL